MNKLAIFDCDGTLVDSGGPIYSALRASLEQNGFAVPPSNVTRRVIGLSLTEAMAALLPDATPDQHARLAEDYRQAFIALRASGNVDEPLFEGILDLLDALEGEGWMLAVATGKSDRGLRHCLDTHGLHARFVSLQTADRHPSKPHRSMVDKAIADSGASAKTTFVIGDTSFDMAMAVNGGATGIGAGWGYHEAEEMIEAGAAAVADRPADVLALLRERVDG